MIEQARAEGLDLGELNWPPEINYETKMEGAFSTMNRLAQGMLKRVLKAEKVRDCVFLACMIFMHHDIFVL